MQAQTAIRAVDAGYSDSSRATARLVIAGCCVAMMAALIGGVGVPGHMVLRHIVQTLPSSIAVILAFRRSQATGWAGLPVFVFWLILMSFIWLYLLGVSHMLSGNFSILEIAMTVVVGVACVIGIGAFTRLRSALSVVSRVGIFIAMGAVQFACFRISFLPAIAHR